jgi:3-hydroxybutyryl-CoA dehydrogenase
MGAQIGLEYALGGHEVVLVNRSAQSANAALERAREALAVLRGAGLVDVNAGEQALRRLVTASEVAEACRGAAVVVESVAEDIELKGAVLLQAAAAAPDAILASNTSSLPISELADRSGAPERVIGTHYWNPPTLMALVEVIPSQATSAAVTMATLRVLRALGKRPVVVGDAPGFVWNRLQFALLREAASLVAAGVVDADTVDEIVKRGLARRWSVLGPFEVMALGGRETFVRVGDWLFPRLANDADATDLRAIDVSRYATSDLRLRRDAHLVRALREDPSGPTV